MDMARAKGAGGRETDDKGAKGKGWGQKGKGQRLAGKAVKGRGSWSLAGRCLGWQVGAAGEVVAGWWR